MGVRRYGQTHTVWDQSIGSERGQGLDIEHDETGPVVAIPLGRKPMPTQIRDEPAHLVLTHADQRRQLHVRFSHHSVGLLPGEAREQAGETRPRGMAGLLVMAAIGGGELAAGRGEQGQAEGGWASAIWRICGRGNA